MPIEIKNKLGHTQLRPFSVLEASEKLRLEQELRKIHLQMNKIVDAIKEITEHL